MAKEQYAFISVGITGAVIAAVKCSKVFIRAGGELNTLKNSSRDHDHDEREKDPILLSLILCHD